MIDLEIEAASPPLFKPNSKCFLEYCFIYPVRLLAPDFPPWFRHESAITSVGRPSHKLIRRE
eukprot:1236858-Amphidinium_carterae.1